jgi:hypothetical protein
LGRWRGERDLRVLGGLSPSHWQYGWVEQVELVEEGKERPAYRSAEELLSAREVYIRVAVIEIVTSVGSRNIYVFVR